MLTKKSCIYYFITFSGFLLGQEVVNYKTITDRPVFPGCENSQSDSLDRCNSKTVQIELMRHLSYPEKAIEEERIGTSYVKFIVSEKGKIDSPRIFRSSKHKDLDSASIATISQLFYDKKIISGKLNNVPVNVFYTIPVKFKLETEQQSDVNYFLTSEEILDQLEKIKSPDFKDAEVKAFSDKYIKFVKGIVSGFYLKDRRTIEDWEEFFRRNNLSKIPHERTMTTHDRIKLTILLREIDYIKQSIKK